MFTSVLLVLVCAAIGAYIRYEARENRCPWLVTAALAVLFLALTLWMPLGQELFGFLWCITGGLAAGALLYGVIARVRG